MRFTLYEIWEVNQNGIVRRARVNAVFNDGRDATFSFADCKETLTVNRFQINTNWRRIQ
jgi:hypothetical protein